MPRAKKKVEESAVANTSGEKWITGGSTGFGNVNISPMWSFPQPETREQFIERVAVGMLLNVREWEVIKQGKTVPVSIYNMAVQMADLLGKRGKDE